MTYRLIEGDALDVLKTLPDNGVSVVLTDPPYGLSFMGKGWDHAVPGPEYWAECLRVAKPGAPLLAFGGTRTFHRLMCAIEDGGWEIRDCLMWVYSSGMPKSHDVSKAIDKTAGATREVVGRKIDLSTGRPMSEKQARQGRTGEESEGWDRPWRSDETHLTNNCMITAPTTELAKSFNGYGTGLKPAWEPIILAMKPLDGTYASNAATWGVAGLNIDASRVPITDGAKLARMNGGTDSLTWGGTYGAGGNRAALEGEPAGRWPANVLLSADSDDTLTRYFYCAKASTRERTVGGMFENNHPTVKPLALLRYLVKLTNPPGGGLFLDPFCGSGTGGMAALLEGAEWVGIDRDPDYIALARRRIEARGKL